MNDAEHQHVLDLLSVIYDREGALIWLHSRNRLLDEQRPLDLLNSPGGTQAVIDLLDQLVGGNF